MKTYTHCAYTFKMFLGNFILNNGQENRNILASNQQNTHRPNCHLQNELQLITNTLGFIRQPYIDTEEIERAITIINEKLSEILKYSEFYLHGANMITILRMIDTIFICIMTFGVPDISGNEYTRNAIIAMFTVEDNLKMLLNKMGQNEHYMLNRAYYMSLGYHYLMDLCERNTQIQARLVEFMRPNEPPADEPPVDEEAEENQDTNYSSSEKMYEDNMSEGTEGMY